MNTPLRYSAFALIGLGAGALGYFLGHEPSSSAAGRHGETIPLAAVHGDFAGSLSGTAMGRLIDGRSSFDRARILYEHASSLSAEALPGAINEAMQLPLQHRNLALGILFARWAEIDPEAAVKYTELLPKSANPGGLRRTALTAWAESDFEAALSWAQSLEKGEARNVNLSALTGVLAKRDPTAALKLISDHFKGRDAANAYDAVFSAWAESDFPAAYSVAMGIAETAFRSRALRGALNQRVDTDPRAVLEAIRMLKLTDLRWDLGNRAISGWLERDPAAARDYAMGLPPGELRDQQFSQIARDMVRREPQAALDWIRELPEDGSREQAIQGLFSSWASTDPKAAYEGAKSLAEGRLRDTALANLAPNLVESDLWLALEIAKSLPPGETSDSAFQGVAWRWARNDPKAAADWFVQNAPANNRWAMSQIVSEWSRSDPTAALEWTLSLSDKNSQKSDLLGQALGSYARNDPVTAAAYLDKVAPDQQSRAVGMLAGTWASRDPAAAAKWAMALGDDAARESAISSVAGTWAHRDAAGAARWLDSLKPGNLRDSAVQSFSFGAVRSDPDGAMAWVATISDSGKREGAIHNIFSVWAHQDRDAAARWLATTPNLADDARSRLTLLIEQANGPRSPGSQGQLLRR